jgi:hypothetical protein
VRVDLLDRPGRLGVIGLGGACGAFQVGGVNIAVFFASSFVHKAAVADVVLVPPRVDDMFFPRFPVLH